MKKVSDFNLVNFSNSFLKHYGVDTFHETIPDLDEILKGHSKIVIMLFDAMGQNIIQKHLEEDAWIRTHKAFTIDSTFPPTTVAATTAVLSARYPVETGWISWSAYLKDLDRTVILFQNVDFHTEEKLPIDISKDYLKFDSIVTLINRKDPSNNAIIMQKYPIQPNGPKDILDGYNKLTEVLKNNEKCFVYFYFDSPDRQMHENGIDCQIIKDKCEEINTFIEKITKENPDTLFISFADHGHINAKYFDLCDNPKLMSMLRKKCSGETRNTCFFVKPEYLNEFKKMFLDLYGQHFYLYSKEEVYKEKLFGEGTPHPLFDDMLGDFISISKDEYSLVATRECVKDHRLKGAHAGGTIVEKLIDVSIYNK